MTRATPAARVEAAAILFDLDGTLLDTRRLIVASFQFVARRYLGRSLDVEREIYPHFGEPLVTTLAAWGGNTGELTAAYRAYNLAHHDRLVRPFPQAAETLSVLREAGLRVAVVTSKLAATAWRGLEVTGLAAAVEVLIGADEPVAPKPSPDGLRLALARLGGLTAAAAVMVGDSPHDLRAARRAGMRAFAVGWSVFPQERLLREGPVALLGGLIELPVRLGLRPHASGGLSEMRPGGPEPGSRSPRP